MNAWTEQSKHESDRQSERKNKSTVQLIGNASQVRWQIIHRLFDGV